MQQADAAKSKKIGRQLSVNSHGNHYSDAHRQEAERALNGIGNGTNSAAQKESFFSHLRKRARRLSGRNQAAAVNYDVEANAGCSPWPNRSSVALDANMVEAKNAEFAELDKAVQDIKYGIESANPPPQLTSVPNHVLSKRQSVPGGPLRSMTESPSPVGGPVSSRTRRALQMSSHPVHRYETPEEEDELLDEVLHSASKAARRLAQRYDEDSSSSLYKEDSHVSDLANDSSRTLNPYPTPSPSAKRDGVSFGLNDSTPVKQRESKVNGENSNRQWPTPPYSDQEWAAAVANTILSESTYR
jgi:meiosis induction protein kinase IME2/SME1